MADGEKGRRRAPALQETDFESKSHQELIDMLEGASSESAAELARKLSGASTTINRIGMGLKSVVARLEWQGKAGDAFHDWGHQAAIATLDLGAYSKNASSWLAEVATAITQAKSALPPRSAALEKQAKDAQIVIQAARHDAGAGDISKHREELRGAQDGMESRRQEAAQQLRKLAQTYVYSAEQISSQAPPTFPAPPAQFMPERPHTLEGTQRSTVDSSGAGGGGTLASATAYTSGAQSAAVDAHSLPSSPGGTSVPTEVARPTLPSVSVPERPVDMGIDSVTTLPQTPNGPSVTPSVMPPGGKSEGLTSLPVGVVPPAFGGKPVPQGPGGIGGRTGPGLRGPLLPGQSSGGSTAGARLPQQNGITGGRPVPQNPGRPTGGIPRGTVIGGESSQARGQAQGRVPGAMPHGGGTGAGSGRGGMMSGRRLASETGGVVGGRQGTSQGRPFTPGGSGLVRNGQSGRMGGTVPGARNAAPRRDREDAERPDYLVEDEETWQQGRRRIVPPVID
ncbi:hypothetical protein AB0O07_23080 [Streptomyces sp. NPDC093085]|uniref:hypothetical protein n=1 Tax=Streptomyces sp. NPDC093085 TaxID=3155068 RepID=UPI003424FB03